MKKVYLLFSLASTSLAFSNIGRPNIGRTIFSNVQIYPSRPSPEPLRSQENKYGSFDYVISNSVHKLEKPCHHQSACANNRYAAGDWLHNVFTLPQSSVLKEIRNPVITIMVWSQLVAIAHRMLIASGSRFLNNIAQNMSIGALPHSLLTSSLGLLLVFRTNSAYQRFMEGRKIWEEIHSLSRNICRYLKIYEDEIGATRKFHVKRLLASFPYLLRHHIRPKCLNPDNIEIDDQYKLEIWLDPYTAVDSRYEGDKSTIKGVVNNENRCFVDRRSLPWSLLPEKVLERCAKAKNRPLWICDRMAQELSKIPYGPNFTSRERLTLISQIDKLSNAIGDCERIHQTAVPLNYARHSLRSLTVWLFSLPFVLVKDLGMLTGVAMGVISWLLFGVYQIGYSIEDPFQKTLRLSILCDAMKKDILGETQRKNQFQVVEQFTSNKEESIYEIPTHDMNIISHDFIAKKTYSDNSISNKEAVFI